MLIFGAFIGLKMLAKPKRRTEEELERGVAESASLLSASIGALQDVLDSGEARAKEVKLQLKEARYNKKKSEWNSRRRKQ